MLLSILYATGSAYEPYNTVKCDILLKLGKDAIHISSYDEIVNYLKKGVKKGDLILTLGAGNVTKIASKLIDYI